MSTLPQAIALTNQQELGAPWNYFVESLHIQDEDPGQGHHAPYEKVVVFDVRAYNGEVPFNVVLGGVDKIDQLIAALELTKARIKVQEAEYALSVAKYQAKMLEPKS